MTWRRRLDQTVKTTLYRTGALSTYDRLRNRRVLAVTMFHRVLARSDPRWKTADPTYTVTDEFLRECLDYFREHYTVIDLKRVSLDHGPGGLPPRPMLITFDDGWSDSADCALPILRQASVTALLFVVAGAVGSRRAFWQERLFGAWREGAIGAPAIKDAWRATESAEAPPGDASEQSVRALIARIGRMPAEARSELVDRLSEGHDDPIPQMMTAEQLRDWDAAGMSVGGHGQSHEPLTAITDARRELVESRRILGRILGRDADGPPTMSFPHGRYDPAIIGMARDAGFKCLFTSNPCLNQARPDGRFSDVLGRVGIDGRHLGDGEGRLRPERLAARLALRPRAAIDIH